MKITVKELRACAAGKHWCRSDNRQRYAVEILELRAEVRRLRDCLIDIRTRYRPTNENNFTSYAVYRWCDNALRARALKPRKPAKKATRGTAKLVKAIEEAMKKPKWDRPYRIARVPEKKGRE